jgi:hypothetical protein
MSSSPPADPERAASTRDDGVDVTLIRWMLSLTPAERLRHLEAQVAFVQKFRGAARKVRR